MAEVAGLIRAGLVVAGRLARGGAVAHRDDRDRFRLGDAGAKQQGDACQARESLPHHGLLSPTDPRSDLPQPTASRLGGGPSSSTSYAAKISAIRASSSRVG